MPDIPFDKGFFNDHSVRGCGLLIGLVVIIFSVLPNLDVKISSDGTLVAGAVLCPLMFLSIWIGSAKRFRWKSNESLSFRHQLFLLSSKNQKQCTDAMVFAVVVTVFWGVTMFRFFATIDAIEMYPTALLQDVVLTLVFTFLILIGFAVWGKVSKLP